MNNVIVETDSPRTTGRGSVQLPEEGQIIDQVLKELSERVEELDNLKLSWKGNHQEYVSLVQLRELIDSLAKRNNPN